MLAESFHPPTTRLVPAKRVRIVAVADTHMQHTYLDVPAGDIFVHAGDFTETGTLEELRAAAKWVNELPHRHKVIISGNHDWLFYNDPDRARSLFNDAHYLQDSEVTVEDLTFYGAPWQPEFCNWAFNLPRGAALAAKWAKIPTGLDVLITHGPPHGFGDRTWLAPGGTGCSDLLRRLRQVRPRLHVFGHIHEDGGAWKAHGSLLANVTTACCRRGATVFDVDMRTHVVNDVHVPPKHAR